MKPSREELAEIKLGKRRKITEKTKKKTTATNRGDGRKRKINQKKGDEKMKKLSIRITVHIGN